MGFKVNTVRFLSFYADLLRLDTFQKADFLRLDTFQTAPWTLKTNQAFDWGAEHWTNT